MSVDHVGIAIARLPQQFKGKPRLAALLTALVQPMSDLSIALDALRDWRKIDTATGASLDVLGCVLRQPRDGANDANFRAALKTQVLILHSDGLPETLLSIVRTVLSWAAGSIRLRPQPPAALLVELLAPATSQVAVCRALGRAKAAGVGVQVLSSPSAQDLLLRFGSVTSEIEGTSLGSLIALGEYVTATVQVARTPLP